MGSTQIWVWFIELEELGKELKTLLTLVTEVKGILSGHQAGRTDLLWHFIPFHATDLRQNWVQHFPNGGIRDLLGEKVHQYGWVFGAGSAVLSHAGVHWSFHFSRWSPNHRGRNFKRINKCWALALLPSSQCERIRTELSAASDDYSIVDKVSYAISINVVRLTVTGNKSAAFKTMVSIGRIPIIFKSKCM